MLEIIKYIAGVSIEASFYYLMLILIYRHYYPIDLTGWLILIIVGIPICLCLKWIGDVILSEKVSLKISDKNFSGKRIIFSLLIFVSIGGILFFLWFIFRSFVGQHFK